MTASQLLKARMWNHRHANEGPDTAFLTRLVSTAPQKRMAWACGRPAWLDTWPHPESHRATGGFFSPRFAIMQQALIRPRYAGYITLQNRAGDILRAEAMSRSRSEAGVMDEMDVLF